MEAPRISKLAVAKLAFAGTLAAMHLAALMLDMAFSNSWLPNIKLSFPCCLAVLHCDAALYCIWVSRISRFPTVGFGLGFIVSGLTILFILCTWQFPSATWVNDSRPFTESLQGQCLITTLLNAPLFAAFAWLISRPKRRDWYWLAFAALLVLAVGNCWLSSTTHDVVSTRSRAWWLEINAIIFYHTLIAGVISAAAIAISAWVITATKHLRSFAMVLATLMGCYIVVGAFRNAMIWSIQETSRYGGWWRGGFNTGTKVLEDSLGSDFNIPFFAALSGLLLSPLLIICHDRSQPLVAPFASNGSPKPLPPDERRHRFWRLASFALFISTLNLFSGLSLHWMRPERDNQYLSQGILFELLFLAPLGLWAAQTGVSALFLQSRVWNIWKRLLLVLLWAEVSMLAFWGQIALSNSIRWNPSDYVGEVLHAFCGAILIASLGASLNYFRYERVQCAELENCKVPAEPTKWLSLSLADIICVVTASAALIYPFSVIFTLELWASPLSVFYEFITTAAWPLAAASLSYFMIRAWLTQTKSDLWNIVAASICLLCCCSYDYPALHNFGDETFFNVRSSLRFTALPALFIGVAVAAIGLTRCSFQVVTRANKPSLSPASKSATASRLRLVPGVEAEPASIKAESPWD